VLPFRTKLRNFLDKLVVEFVVIAIVLVYMVLILVDLLLADEPKLSESWVNAFRYVDLGFLVFFTVELIFRLYAYGFRYLYSFINTFDALIVVISLVLQLYYIVNMSDLNTPGFLSALRLVRLMRLMVVMNKVQKTRAAYKKTKYLKLGSPVERVMELLKDLLTRAESDDMKSDVDWIMQLIASDKLYAIDLRSASGGKIDKEMSDWLSSNMGMKKEKDMDGESATTETDTVTSLSEAAGLRRQESGFVSQGGAQELELIDEVTELPEMAPVLDKIHSWDADPFELHRLSRNSGLVVGMHKLLHEYGLIDKFRLSQHRLLTYFRTIQEGYLDNPYHNSVHALDVVLNTNYFIRQEAVANLITPLDRLACLLAASIHDHQHPGLTNNFLMATKHEYAIKYNDQSVLESHHVASSWSLLMQDDMNFLRSLSREQYMELRDTVIQIVLGTDMKFHFEHYTKFKTKMSSDTFQPGCEREDVKFLLSVSLHTADISNPAKNLQLCLRWTEQVMEEFFRQGDLEASMGLPVSPFYDRHTTSIAQCQMGFINVLVKPLFAEYSALLGEPALTDCLGSLQSNLTAWEQQGNALLNQRAGAEKTVSS